MEKFTSQAGVSPLREAVIGFLWILVKSDYIDGKKAGEG